MCTIDPSYEKEGQYRAQAAKLGLCKEADRLIRAADNLRRRREMGHDAAVMGARKAAMALDQ